MLAREIKVERFTDSRGSLIAGEFPKNLPFEPVRFFLVSGVPEGESRGMHAHKTNLQLLFCVSGSVIVSVNDGVESKEFNLKPGLTGLFIPAMNWAEQKYESPETQLLVLASEPYSSDGYISDINIFNSHFS
jgi:UDP-2-acetamido-3-amino-2,3-dideoxy-glucuronate N-acetyltransferase